MTTNQTTVQTHAAPTGVIQPPAASAPAAAPVPRQALPAPVEADGDSVYVPAPPVPATATPAAPSARPEPAQRPAGRGIPAGPLLLSVVNGVGLATSTALYAGGIPAAATVGTLTAGAGALRTAYAFRRVTKGRGRGYGYGGLWGRRGGLLGGAGRWGRQSGRWAAGRAATGSGSVGSAGGSLIGSGGSTGRVRSPLLDKGARRAAAETAGSASASSPGLAAAAGRAAGPASASSPGLAAAAGRAARTAGAAGAAGGVSLGKGVAGGSPGGPAAGGSARQGAGRAADGARRAAARRAGLGGKAAQTIAAARRRAEPIASHVGKAGKAFKDGVPRGIGKAGSGAAKAWKDGKRTRRNTRRFWRLARKRTVSFVLAAVAGTVAQVLMPWRPGVGWRVGVRVWNWRANRSRAVEDARDAENAQADAKDAAKKTKKKRKAKVNDPGRASGPKAAGAAPTTGGTVSGVDQVFARAAEAVATAYSQYSPPSMMAVAAEYEGLPSGIRHAAAAVAHLALNTQEVYPAHAAVADAVTAACAALLDAAKAADEVAPTFRQVHAPDIERFEAPRNGYSGEVMWNIGGRPGDGGTTYQSVFSRSAEEVATVYAQWQPQVMTEVGREYEGLPTGIEHLATAVKNLAIHSQNSYPVDPQIAEMVGLVHHRLMQSVSAAQDVIPVFRRVHAPDLARHEAPRNGAAAEAMWNV
ncbi:hypothetical protein ACIBCA_36795 [Kitasatospora sp. NPDC051170]|uniref:hypothetical protein n=1 Tax=Kitasatospora sp. NPDC051170 TaxID=3364056 RepID=UPI0037B41E35